MNYKDSVMKKILLVSTFALALTACHHDTLDDRAEQVTKDYTERYCPTPVQDMQRTDSLTFTRETHTFNFYYTLTDKADNADVISKQKGKIVKELLQQLKDNTSYKVFKEAGFNFHYVFRSASTKKLLLESTFSKQQYKK